MKILFISSGNAKDGIKSIIKNQGDSLKKAGVEIDYFTIKGKGIKSYLKYIFILKKYLKTNKYDLFHAHYGWCGIVTLLAIKNKKLVISFMGDDLIGSVGYNNKYHFSSKLISRINIFLSKHFYDFNIVKSENLRNLLASMDNKEKIPNGVDIQKFCEIEKVIAKKKIRFIEDKRYVLFVSNPVRPEKNYNLAVEACKLLANNCIELFAVHNVTIDKLVYYYNAAECIILTSHHEGSPNVIKEAMACNCPIVSTNVGDVKWIFGNTDGCYLASSDLNDFAEKLKLALEFAKNNGKTKGRERIMNLGLDSESIAKKIIKIYEKMILTN